MPRIRTIKPEFFHDPDLAECSLLARLTFIGLWCHADREGRLKDEPRRLRGVLFPYESVNIDEAIDELSARRFVRRYESGGVRYLAIRTFGQHQRPHHTEPASAIPAPETVGVPPDFSGGLPTTTVLPQEDSARKGKEGKGKEGKGREGNGDGKEQAAPPPMSPPLMGFRNEHAYHAMCGKVCVPAKVWREMVEARGGDEQYVQQYVEKVWEAVDGEVVPLERFSFWRTHWDADHPAPTAKELRRKREDAVVAAWVPKGGVA